MFEKIQRSLCLIILPNRTARVRILCLLSRQIFLFTYLCARAFCMQCRGDSNRCCATDTLAPKGHMISHHTAWGKHKPALHLPVSRMCTYRFPGIFSVFWRKSNKILECPSLLSPPMAPTDFKTANPQGSSVPLNANIWPGLTWTHTYWNKGLWETVECWCLKACVPALVCSVS